MTDVERGDALDEATGRAVAGGPERHRLKATEQGKLPVRERVARLLDSGSFPRRACWPAGIRTGSAPRESSPESARSAGAPWR